MSYCLPTDLRRGGLPAGFDIAIIVSTGRDSRGLLEPGPVGVEPQMDRQRADSVDAAKRASSGDGRPSHRVDRSGYARPCRNSICDRGCRPFMGPRWDASSAPHRSRAASTCGDGTTAECSHPVTDIARATQRPSHRSSPDQPAHAASAPVRSPPSRFPPQPRRDRARSPSDRPRTAHRAGAKSVINHSTSASTPSEQHPRQLASHRVSPPHA